jgi:hypothetical protein
MASLLIIIDCSFLRALNTQYEEEGKKNEILTLPFLKNPFEKR